jgi:hypothetical protein
MPLLCFRFSIPSDGRPCRWEVHLQQVRPYSVSGQYDVPVSLSQMLRLGRQSNGELSGSGPPARLCASFAQGDGFRACRLVLRMIVLTQSHIQHLAMRRETYCGAGCVMILIFSIQVANVEVIFDER